MARLLAKLISNQPMVKSITIKSIEPFLPIMSARIPIGIHIIAEPTTANELIHENSSLEIVILYKDCKSFLPSPAEEVRANIIPFATAPSVAAKLAIY
ncbi:hypothetical protein QLX08_004278 [Tetragonisca angustula]|uniref:Uncharacterized protein n=1 Tax=Tetragonisca angustula TaxID=166442 RepID=A0AAW1A2L6_9HYME